MYVENAPLLIRQFLPRMRLICILREPIERAMAEYDNKVGASKRRSGSVGCITHLVKSPSVVHLPAQVADGTVGKYLYQRSWREAPTEQVRRQHRLR